MASTWTYTENPASVPRDRIRFLIGDVKQAPTSLSDDELAYLLTDAGGNAEMAAANAADLWAGRFAGLSASSKSIGDLSISTDYSSSAARLYGVARRLRARHGGIGIPLIADDRAAVFSVGRMDNPGVAGQGDEYVRWF